MPVESRICVGAIAGAFGVRGDVRLKSFCAQPEAIAAYAPLFTEDGTRSFTIKLLGSVPNGFSARVGGISTREEAEALKGTRLFADRSKMPPPEDDEFYHVELIGLDVIDAGGTLLGKIAAVLNHGASDILEVRGPNLPETLLLPFTKAVVPTVDIAGGRVIVDLPEGVL